MKEEGELTFTFQVSVGNFGKTKEEANSLVKISTAQQLMESQRYSVGAKINQSNNNLVHGQQTTTAALNGVKSQQSIGGGAAAHKIGPINSKSIDTATLKQSQRRLVSSGQKNLRQGNVQAKHQRGQGQPILSN